MNINKILKNIKITENNCWEWLKSTNSTGYGQLTEDGKYWLAHRYAKSCAELVSEDDIIRHTCHNRKCCNPEHLEVGTHLENYYDSLDKHRMASKGQRNIWEINGIIYDTVRDASSETGLSLISVIKYTEDGVFNIEKYRSGCIIANKIPRV